MEEKLDESTPLEAGRLPKLVQPKANNWLYTTENVHNTVNIQD